MAQISKDLNLHIVHIWVWSQVMPSPILCGFGSSWLALYVVHSFHSAITESGSVTTNGMVGLQAAYHSTESLKPGRNRVNTTKVKINFAIALIYLKHIYPFVIRYLISKVINILILPGKSKRSIEFPFEVMRVVHCSALHWLRAQL